MTTPTKILAFAGSNRKDSLNKKLVRIAAQGAEEAGAKVTLIDLRDFPLPLYNGDLEAAEGLPESATNLKRLMVQHDGLLIASPEYNSSISPLLKNAIDWASRPAASEPPLVAYTNKVATLMSASPGALGGLRGLVHLRAILGNIGVIVLPDQIANFFDAAKRAEVGHVVKFSGLRAGEANSVIHHQHDESDRMLKASGLASTILRPNSFYQNMLMAAGTIKSMGKFFMPLGDAKQSCVDVRDIADVAVKALTEKGHEGKVYDITGPQALSFHEVAAVLSKVLGRTVEYVPVPNEAAKQSMLQAGMPPWNAAAVAEIMGVFATGKYGVRDMECGGCGYNR